MAELVDAADLKSVACKGVRVQVPLSAPHPLYQHSTLSTRRAVIVAGVFVF